MAIEDIFAQNLKRLRKAKSLSQEALAHEAGLDRSYISSLERCEYSATIGTIDALARVLGVPAHELLVDHGS